MANSKQLRKQIRGYLDATEDADGHPINRRELAYSNQRQYLIIRGEAVVQCLNSNTSPKGLDVKKIFDIFRDEIYTNRSSSLIK